MQTVQRIGTKRWVRRAAVATGMVFILASMIIPAAIHASRVSTPHAFRNGDIADAQQMNENFDAVRDAVNDNDSRIDDLLGRVEELERDASGNGPSAGDVADALVENHLDEIRGLQGNPGPRGADGQDGVCDPSDCQLPVGGGCQITFSEADIDSPILGTNWVTILQLPVNVPSRGSVHLVANATFNISDAAPNPALLGIATTNNGTPVHNVARVAHQQNDPDQSIRLAVTTQVALRDLSPGRPTFFLVARRSGDSGGQISVSFPQMTATFCPD
jgi:hypothetical protein